MHSLCQLATKLQLVHLGQSDLQIKLETGEIGRQANGSIMATCGETVRLSQRLVLIVTNIIILVIPLYSPMRQRQILSHLLNSYYVPYLQMVYVTACCSDFPTGDGQFVPLTVNYAERFSAAGKTR